MNIPTELLRTLVAVVEQGTLSAAGEVVGRSQPAISLQLKKLESLIGKPLLRREGRGVTLTDAGEVVLRHARDLLRVNDALVRHFHQPRLRGDVRLGIPNEFAISVLPPILGDFNEAHPDVSLHVTCDLSARLIELLGQGSLDVVVALSLQPHPGALMWREEPLNWARAPHFEVESRGKLPLVVAPHGCVYRYTMFSVMSQQTRPWQVAYTGTSYGGIQAAVLAGLGVTAMARSTLDNPQLLIVEDQSAWYPPLRSATLSILCANEASGDAIQRLVARLGRALGMKP
ncbi:LysR substrate-binding domain-containing protein [Gammaproteobacteria bacterium]|nr:LysR substrate-binding domain-containing protein [Gammaproteobacteria bacterium]